MKLSIVDSCLPTTPGQTAGAKRGPVPTLRRRTRGRFPATADFGSPQFRFPF